MRHLHAPPLQTTYVGSFDMTLYAHHVTTRPHGLLQADDFRPHQIHTRRPDDTVLVGPDLVRSVSRIRDAQIDVLVPFQIERVLSFELFPDNFGADRVIVQSPRNLFTFELFVVRIVESPFEFRRVCRDEIRTEEVPGSGNVGVERRSRGLGRVRPPFAEGADPRRVFGLGVVLVAQSAAVEAFRPDFVSVLAVVVEFLVFVRLLFGIVVVRRCVDHADGERRIPRAPDLDEGTARLARTGVAARVVGVHVLHGFDF